MRAEFEQMRLEDILEMKLFLAILDYILVAMNIWLAKESEGTSRTLNIICAVLWLMRAIINTGLFISQL